MAGTGDSDQIVFVQITVFNSDHGEQTQYDAVYASNADAIRFVEETYPADRIATNPGARRERDEAIALLQEGKEATFTKPSPDNATELDEVVLIPLPLKGTLSGGRRKRKLTRRRKH
jgi:hypothetical protein